MTQSTYAGSATRIAILPCQHRIVAVDNSGCLAVFCSKTADQVVLYKDAHIGAASALCTSQNQVRTCWSTMQSVRKACGNKT
jgi:hypothetical protein